MIFGQYHTFFNPKRFPFSKCELLKAPSSPKWDLRNQSFIVFINVNFFLLFSLAYSKSRINRIALSHLEKNNFWSLNLAALKIRNVFDDAQLSSCLHHRCLMHSRRLTNVPGEMKHAFSLFVLKRLSDQEGTSFSLLYT